MRALGFPATLIKEMLTEPGLLQKAKAQAEPLLYSTVFYVECSVAKELGLTLEQYRRLSRREQKIWRLFHTLANEKERYAYESAKDDAKRDSLQQPKTAPISKLRS